MANFPTGLVETPHHIHPHEMPAKFAAPFMELRDRGFTVVEGLSAAHIGDLALISAQKGVQEFCPRDLSERWADVETVEKQFAAGKHRGIFRL